MMAQIFPLHFPARSRARIGGVVMTTLRQIELRCPVCDNEFKSQSVVSTNAFGGKRTDFHERAAGTQPLAYLIHMCSECGYSGGEADFTAPTDVSPVLKQQVLKESRDRKSTRLNSSHTVISYAVFCLKKKKQR